VPLRLHRRVPRHRTAGEHAGRGDDNHDLAERAQAVDQLTRHELPQPALAHSTMRLASADCSHAPKRHGTTRAARPSAAARRPRRRRLAWRRRRRGASAARSTAHRRSLKCPLSTRQHFQLGVEHQKRLVGAVLAAGQLARHLVPRRTERERHKQRRLAAPHHSGRVALVGLPPRRLRVRFCSPLVAAKCDRRLAGTYEPVDSQ
jgi:hypothetical protein